MAVQRRLAAILAADVVSYSLLMGADEEGTLAALTAHLTELIEPCIAEHRGRVVKTTGDGLLAEFASVVDAVRCAVAFQDGMAVRNAGVPEDQSVAFRIGVNLGDVIVQDDDVFGDGVNVAARIEGLCETGEVYVSAVVQDQVDGKIDAAFEDLGAHTLKNIDKPIGVFRVSSRSSPRDAMSRAAGVGSVFERPAVAVMPFENMGGDPDQEFFADGLTEDIVTMLSLWRSFPVIARNSTAAYKGTSTDIRTVGKELGARYVIEGSVRRAGERVRVTAQLIDANSGRQVWTERFDRRMDDIFDLQDELTQRIAATVVPELEQEEHKRAVLKPPHNLDAWEFYLRGVAALHDPAGSGTAEAREMFAQALERDPDYARAHAWTALSHILDVVLGQSESQERSIESLVAGARRAVKLDRADSMSQLMLGIAYTWTDEDALSIAAAERSIELNPSNASAHGHLGTMLDVVGRHDEGIASLEHCIRLSPKEPLGAHVHMTFLARAHLAAGRYDDAIEWGQKALAQHAPYPPATYIIAIALAHLGRQAEAQEALEQCEREQPGFVEQRRQWQPYRDPSKNEHILDGLRIAELPD